MVQQTMPNPHSDREAWREWVRSQPGVVIRRNVVQSDWTQPLDIRVDVQDINELTGDDWDETELAEH